MSTQAIEEETDIIETRVALRKSRGSALAKRMDFVCLPVLGTVYLVPSKTRNAKRAYLTDPSGGGEGACTCPDWRRARIACKHVWALREYRPPTAAPVDADLAAVLTSVIDTYADSSLNFEDVDVVLNMLRVITDEQKRRSA